jgi:hypothetical protein
MLWPRIWIFSFACIVAAVWVFPSVETSYSTWSVENGPETPFKVLQSRSLITEAEFGTRHVRWESELIFGRTFEERSFNVPFSRMSTVLKQTAINWPSQILQTVLVIAFFLGLRWASGREPFLPIKRPSA